jgi:hypothetical protein
MMDLVTNLSAPLNVLYALAPTIVMLIAANLLVDRSGEADALAVRADA